MLKMNEMKKHMLPMKKKKKKYTLKIKKIIKHTNQENASLTCIKNNYEHIA